MATAADVRFTKKGDALYAICLAVPAGEARIKTLGTSAGHSTKPVAHVQLLGNEEPLKCWQAADALVIQRPQSVPNPHALAFKIEFARWAPNPAPSPAN